MSRRVVAKIAHRDLIDIGIRWLRRSCRCDVVFAEPPSGGTGLTYEADVIGWTSDGTCHYIEVKSDRRDYKAERKKSHAATANMAGRHRWYLVPRGLLGAREVTEGWGLIETTGPRACVVIKRAPSCASNLDDEGRILAWALRYHQRKLRWNEDAARFDDSIAPVATAPVAAIAEDGTPKTIDKMSREEYIRTALLGVRQDLEAAHDRGAFTAISTLRKQERELRDEFDRLIAAGRDGRALEEVDDDALVAMQVEAMRALPTHLLEPIAAALVERMGERSLTKLIKALR